MLTGQVKLLSSTLSALMLIVVPAAHAAMDPVAEKPSGSNTTDVKPAEDGLLSGPKVERDANAEKQGPGMGRSERGLRGMREGLPFPAWLRVVHALDLSQEQRTQARAIAQEFQAAAEAFQKEHGQRMHELQEQLRQARQNQTDPPKDVAKAMQELRSQAPKPEAYQKRIWELLTEAQQTELKPRLHAATEEMKKRREGRPEDGTPGRDGQPRRRPGAERDGAKPDEPGVTPTRNGPDDQSRGKDGNDRGRRRGEPRRNPGDAPPSSDPPPTKDPGTP